MSGVRGCDVGDQLEISWRLLEEQLETSWRPVGDQLETTWRPLGDHLGTTGDHLGTTWHELSFRPSTVLQFLLIILRKLLNLTHRKIPRKLFSSA